MASPRRTTTAVWAVGLTVLVVLVVAVATDLQAHARNRTEHANLVAAQRDLSDLHTGIAATSYRTVVTTNRRNALEASITSTLSDLTGTESALSGATSLAYFQGINIGTIETCLGGVQSSYRQIAVHDNAEAAHDIAAVSSACSTLAGGPSSGLAYPFDFPDPYVLLVGTTYYAYATNSVAGNIQIIQSTDLSHWTSVGDALPNLPVWATPHDTWAPGVVQLGGTFVLYYATRMAGPGGGGYECISEATATQPQGPFLDASTGPLMCQPSLGGSIDPSPFVDTDGTPYLVWKSNGGGGASALWSEQLNATGTGFAVNTTPAELLAPDQGWQAGTIEAPDLVVSGGRYFLFYSGGLWKGPNYGVGVASCTGPVGPCTEAQNGPVLSSGSDIEGPGGESVFFDASGAPWIAFHAWTPGAVGYPNSRSLYLRRIDLSGAVPVVQPST